MTEPTTTPSKRRARASWTPGAVAFYGITGAVILCGSVAFGILLAIPV